MIIRYLHVETLLYYPPEVRSGEYGGGSIPVAKLPSCQYLKMLLHALT